MTKREPAVSNAEVLGVRAQLVAVMRRSRRLSDEDVEDCVSEALVRALADFVPSRGPFLNHALSHLRRVESQARDTGRRDAQTRSTPAAAPDASIWDAYAQRPPRQHSEPPAQWSELLEGFSRPEFTLGGRFTAQQAYARWFTRTEREIATSEARTVGEALTVATREVLMLVQQLWPNQNELTIDATPSQLANEERELLQLVVARAACELPADRSPAPADLIQGVLRVLKFKGDGVSGWQGAVRDRWRTLREGTHREEMAPDHMLAIRRFLAECCTAGPLERVTQSELCERYGSFTAEQGLPSLGNVAFAEIVASLDGVQKRRDGKGLRFDGVGLKR